MVSFPTSTDTKPKRQAIACDYCRQRKKRCDGVKPACSNCAKAGHGCCYTKKRRSEPYITPLTMPQYTTFSRNRSHSLTPVAVQPMPMRSRSMSLHPYMSPTTPTMSPLGFANASPFPEYILPSSLYPVPETDMSFVFGNGMPENVSQHLIGLYFVHIHPQLPILHSPHFFTQLQNKGIGEELLNAIYALAAVYSDNPYVVHFSPLKSERGLLFAEKAAGKQGFDVETLQVKLLLVHYEMCGGRLNEATVLLAEVAAIAMLLELHTEEYLDEISPDEMEERRRLWWMIYASDRMISFMTSTPLRIREGEYSVGFPCCDDDWLCESGTSVFSHIVKLWDIIGSIVTEINSSRSLSQEAILRLDAALQSWDFSLPKCLMITRDFHKDQSINANALLAASLHTQYYNAMLVLHRNKQISISSHDSYRVASFDSLTLSAELISDFSKMFPFNQLLGYHVFTLYSAGTVHVLNAFAQDSNLKMSSRMHLQQIFTLFRRCASRWKLPTCIEFSMKEFIALSMLSYGQSTIDSTNPNFSNSLQSIQRRLQSDSLFHFFSQRILEKKIPFCRSVALEEMGEFLKGGERQRRGSLADLVPSIVVQDFDIGNDSMESLFDFGDTMDGILDDSQLDLSNLSMDGFTEEELYAMQSDI